MGGEEILEELGGTPGDSWKGNDDDDASTETDLAALAKADEGTAMVIQAVDEFPDNPESGVVRERP